MAMAQAPVRSLPTLQRLGSTLDPDVDVQAVAKAWFTRFVDAMTSKDVAAILDLIVDDVFWRDMLALTWNFHTYEGTDAVKQFLTDQLPKFDLSEFKLREELVMLTRPYEDLVWIMGVFNFDTTVGHVTGIFRLVPLADGSWKAHGVFTNLDDLKGFPEKTGLLRNLESDHGDWAEMRKREQEFLDEDPCVLIIGAGHSGLDAAARLKMLGIPSLVVERHNRIGDNWRTRYAGLRLQSHVWWDHRPYIPFPPSWPMFSPALKLANWLESYAQALDLNVWTSSTAVSITPGTKEKRWSVRVVRGDGRERTFEVNHVVFATGFSSGKPMIPNIPGREEFNGQVLHSSQFKLATAHVGEKVAVVGSCTSAHDICSDYVNHGIDVTMVQRGPTYVLSAKKGLAKLIGDLYSENSPPTEIADRICASLPNHFFTLLHQRVTKDIAEDDKDILEGLRKVGFKLTFGEDSAGLMPLHWKRLGGYYLDVGGSQKIIDGKIKLKSDGPIAKFTSTGLLFEDGSTLDADVVIFATGYGDAREPYYRLLPENLHIAVMPVWGLDEEGEINSAWREIGGCGPESKKLDGLWSMVGHLAISRFHSKHIALQIKAYEEGIFGERY